jgi:peptidoglycan/LPS O-acetylase OafA/YrhL
MTRGRLKALDGLRSVAVLLVFAHHVDARAIPGGWIGVDLFFALSGYLITTLLLLEFQKGGSIRLGDFYIRRALRLTPALVVLVALVTPVAFALSIGRPDRDAPAAILYLMDVYAPLLHTAGGAFGHTWSLAVEEQFYLVWPLMLLLLLRTQRRITPYALAICIVFTATGATLVTAFSTFDIYRSPIPHIPELMTGVLLAVMVSRSRPWLTRIGHPALAGLLVVGLLVGSALLQQTSVWLFRGGYLILGLAMAALVGNVVVSPTGPAARIFSAAPAVWLGERSYGFYLWHYPVLYALSRWLGSPWIRGGVGFVVTVALTVASWRIVEQPFLRAKERRAVARPHVGLADREGST